VTQSRTTTLLAASFELLQTLYADCDERDQLQLAKLSIEVDAARALEERIDTSRALAKQFEIKLLSVNKLITTSLIERLGYYALPDELPGENEKPLLGLELRELLRKHYVPQQGFDEDFQLRNQLVEILAEMDDMG